MYYLQTRYYDPSIGQFISPDSPEYLDPETINGLSLYAYCNYNPVMNVDPSGHIVLSTIISTLVIGFIIGGLIGGVSNAVIASQNGQDITNGFWAGFWGGAIMGAGAGVASLFLAPVLAGASVAIGITSASVSLSAGTALAIGTSIAIATGAIGGATTEMLLQYYNTGTVYDGGTVALSALQYGVVNAINAFFYSFIASPAIVPETSIFLASTFTFFTGLMTGLLGISLDMMRSSLVKLKR